MFDFSKNKFIGVLILESIFSGKARRLAGRALTLAVVLVLLALGYLFLLSILPEGLGKFISAPFLADTAGSFWSGLLFIFLSGRLFILGLDAFVNSKTADPTGEGQAENFAERFNFRVSELWYGNAYAPDNTTGSLLRGLGGTPAGKVLLLRLGVSEREYKEAVGTSTKEFIPLVNFLKLLKKNVPVGKEVSLADFAGVLFETHKTSRDFFAERGVGRETVRRAAEWVEGSFKKSDLRRRWWRKEFLGRVRGLGKSLAYGRTWVLRQFAYDMSEEALGAEVELVGKERETELLETALLKKAGANVILVGEPGAGKHTVLLGLAKMVVRGKVFPELEYKRIWKLRGAAVSASGKTGREAAALLINIMNEAVGAGNIILAIEEFPEFVDSLKALGASPTEIFAPYLNSRAVHIIGLADRVSFRKNLERDEGLMKYFERVDIEEPDERGIIEILKNLAPEAERARKGRVIVTYPALEKIGEGAANYLTEGALPKRAVELMGEAADETARKGAVLVTPEIVAEVLERKTKIPLGRVSGGEREKLLRLEEVLHQRVVDQKEAIQAIADAIKRTRVGIRNPKRPIGSFLFLGPTGVGKTETAKALAEAYFGDEEKMIRLDMTEYQDENAILRLIGNFETNEQGILASRVRSSPYSVVLLDEFEKTHLKVKNLFLQILDEGFFSDYAGERVNLRNTIIIATSNAGAQMIWELAPRLSSANETAREARPTKGAGFTQKGRDVAGLEREIIAHIQRERIMSPELINRFDAVIVFRPLTPEFTKEIAKILLARLASRLKKQNITLKITDELVSAVAEGGYDPAFGARPMQRFIQDKIEKEIAEKIIKGEIKPGSEVVL